MRFGYISFWKGYGLLMTDMRYWVLIPTIDVWCNRWPNVGISFHWLFFRIGFKTQGYDKQ